MDAQRSRRMFEDGPIADRLDTMAAVPLFDVLTSRVGTGLVIDGSCLERTGGLCPQVPLVALSTRRADGVPFAFIHLSSDFVAGFELLGIGPQHFLDRELSQ